MIKEASMIKEGVTFRKQIYKDLGSRSGVFYIALLCRSCLAV